MNAKKRGKKSGSADPHRDREQAKYDSPIASREFITSLLRAEKGPMDFEALAERLDLTGNDTAMEALRRRVGAMLRDGQLIQNRKRGLVPVDTDALIAGRISAHPDGFGFVIADDGDKDVYLNGKQMRQVLHGDRVVVCITGIDHRGRREGRIVDVVERANKSLVGRLSIDRGTVVVLPDSKRIHQDLLIAPGELNDANDGDMVVAEIVEQPSRRHQPVGRVVEVLGQHLRPGMEIDVALHSHGIPTEWPQEVTEQAASFSATVDKTAAKGRKDVRDLSLITIDGADARDFDDAVWCERLDKGWRLLVAIADVAHYVATDSPLDVEAVERGTSVYFPGRVVPMLPEVLSNGLCSLNPEVDRLCMLCELTLDDKAVVKKAQFFNGIMRSHARLTYDQVSEMLTSKSSALRKKHKPLVPMIEELHRLYKALAKKRKKRGAIEFDSTETHIIFDGNKKISEIVPIQRNDAHKLIEECMILANIQAAAFLEQREVPALYRVHAGPKPDRLEDLRSFLALHELSLSGGDSPSALDYAALANAISERSDRSVIQTVMLRSMQQAVYQPKNEGHFGLALEQYAHFTSPIRRYPDLLVHRAIKYAIKRGKAGDYRYTNENMQALGESCSMTERRAEEASRDVVAWLKCEYMQDHVGSEFPGVISAVTSFGLFVELTGIHVEGLVHVTNLSHDFYRFEQAAHALTGERTGKQYHLGDAIVVQVAAVNLEERKIDFTEVAHEQTRGKRARRNGQEKKRTAGVGKPKASMRAKTVTGASSAPQESSKSSKSTKSTKSTKSNRAGQVEGVGGKVVSAEKRRQERRRIKQQRRDEKRETIRQAKKLEKQAQTKSPAGSKPDTGITSKKRVARKATTKVGGSSAVSADKTGTQAAKAGGAGKAGTKSKARTGVKASAKATYVKTVRADTDAAEKPVNRKTATSKTAVSKTAARKTVAKKTPASKTAIPAVTRKKSATRKTTAKKAPTSKTSGKTSARATARAPMQAPADALAKKKTATTKNRRKPSGGSSSTAAQNESTAKRKTTSRRRRKTGNDE